MMRWLYRVLRHSRVESQLDLELRDHIERAVADHVAAGMDEVEAKRRVRLEFGGLDQIKELCRDARGTRWLEDFVQDVGHGMRVLRKHPSFTAAAVVSLALGIGATTAIFTIVHVALLKALPVYQPHELVELLTDRGGGPGNAFSYQALAHLQDHATAIDVIASHQATFFVGSQTGTTEVATGQFVTGNYFAVLGVPAFHGRLLEVADQSADEAATVVLSHGYWQRRFGGDRSVVGHLMTLNDHAFTVVGIAPPSFRGLVTAREVDFWIPLSAEPRMRTPSWTSDAGYKWLQLVGRVRRGSTVEAARAEYAALFRAAVIEPDLAVVKDPTARERYNRFRPVVESARAGLSLLRQEYGRPLLVLLIISGVVLLIACVNVANLMLARATTQRHEVAVRLSLGARRGRVIRQFLTESLLLSVGGAAAGVLVAYAACRSLATLLATTRTPILLDVEPDLRVLAFSALLALATGLLCGFAPAWRATAVVAPAMALHASHRLTGGRDRRFLPRGLVAAQVALSVMMLFSGGLFLRSLYNVRSIDKGFDSSSVLLVNTDSSRGKPEPDTLRARFRSLVTRLAALPGVRSASVSEVTPIWGGGTELTVTLEPHGSMGRREAESVSMNWVSPGYFDTMGTALRAGRDFTWQDAVGSPPVAIVNEAMARQYFVGLNPMGARVTMRDVTYEIVALVADSKYLSLRQTIPPTMYFHWIQQRDDRLTAQSARMGQFAVRTAVSPLASAETVRAAIHEVAPSTAITKLWTLDDQVNASIVRDRLLSILSGFFAVVGLLLAALGLYGVMAYTVTRRTSEIGLRMALGASPRQIGRMVVQEALLVTVAGAVAGIGAALLLARSLATLLFGLTPTDPFTAVVVVAVMLLTGALAAYWPGRRAARIEPTLALRTE
jgi:predicted permease